MDDAFVFYAYWNGNQIRDLFEGVGVGHQRLGLCAAGGLLVVTGMVACLLIGAVKGEGRSVISYFACAVLFWFVAIVPKATVVIEDVRSQTVYNVDNVPLSMAFFASASSRIGHWLTQAYETAFIPADVAKYSSFGAVYPQRVMEVLQRTGPVTVQGRETLQAVLKNCVLPEVVLDGRKADEAMASSDLWTLIKSDGWVNPARLAVMPDGSVLKCPAAVAELEQVLVNVEIPALKRWVHVKLDPQAVNPSTSIAASITQTESLLLGISRSAESSLKHSLLLTALPKVMSGHAVTVAGPAAMASTLARAQGNLAGEINYRTMAKMAEDALPKIRNALEFVVIAMFPVVALIALVSGSGMAGVVRSYVTLLLTVQLWPALSSVVNYLVIAHDLHPFTLLAQNFGGSSLQAATLIRETGASSQAIAGALLCAVPVISYALVRAGDMAVGQLVGGLTQPAPKRCDISRCRNCRGKYLAGQRERVKRVFEQRFFKQSRCVDKKRGHRHGGDAVRLRHRDASRIRRGDGSAAHCREFRGGLSDAAKSCTWAFGFERGADLDRLHRCCAILFLAVGLKQRLHAAEFCACLKGCVE